MSFSLRAFLSEQNLADAAAGDIGALRQAVADLEARIAASQTAFQASKAYPEPEKPASAAAEIG